MTRALVPRPPAEILAISDGAGAYVTKDEIRRARAVAKPIIRGLIGLMWVTGARISEALAVRASDLDVNHQVVTLATLKRKQPTVRRCPIPGEYFAELLGLVVDQQQRSTKKHGTIDQAARLFPLSRSQAYELIRRALLAAGVERGRARTHAIRHGHAHFAIKAGVPLNVIQRQLGHVSIVTTSKYLEATADDVRAAHRGVDW